MKPQAYDTNKARRLCAQRFCNGRFSRFYNCVTQLLLNQKDESLEIYATLNLL